MTIIPYKFTNIFFCYLECPGGFSQACSGHGVCSDLINGTGQCTCEVGHTVLINPYHAKSDNL